MSTHDFFRSRLDQMIDLRHPLAVLATRLPWAEIEAAVAPKLARQALPAKRLRGEDLRGAYDVEFGGGVSPAGRPRLGELLQSRQHCPCISGARQLHRTAVAPVVAQQAQGQTTWGRDVSTLAPLRALRARASDQLEARRVVGEGVKSCPRAGCGKSACPVR